jgi:uncharacterized membrane protein
MNRVSAERSRIPSPLVVGDINNRATLWTSGSTTFLPGPGATVADAINDSGTIVGFSSKTGNAIPTVWKGGSVEYLKGTGGRDGGAASDINDSGQVAGFTDRNMLRRNGRCNSWNVWQRRDGLGTGLRSTWNGGASVHIEGAVQAR